ncbi:sulfatase [Phytohabitans sp. ZYX-F-186]|uniref:Sulfatase n=1 Tax=Phytohabitans maris TaxID=3071409 RepID=A0ABU0ZB97_9ACTN|nr:sulfatase [Phytohabitans sp. ZYX-F-186]MDQ7903699.1 sulfatase [Phytohabitans sp. ZYX-F-186]
MSTPLSRRTLLSTAAAVAAAPVAATADAGPAQAHGTGGHRPPNILLFTVDDMDFATPGCFGGHRDVTPALDRFARQSMSFHRAHVPLAVCQPSRSALLTGRYPHRNGAEGFGPVRDDVPILNESLRERDYLTGILGKVTHLAPIERYAWDYAIDQEGLGMGRDPAVYAAGAADVFRLAKRERRPFFMMANAHDPHRPYHGSLQERQMFTPEQLATVPPPAKVFGPGDADVPGFLPDLPDVRTEQAQYLSSSRRADQVFAAVLAELARAGLADDTIVVFISDNGTAMPFAKANAYPHSTHTPLVVRWPGKTRPGSTDRAHMVSTMDLFPLFCRAAGVRPPDGIDGRDPTSLLEGRHQTGRTRVHTVFHETSARQRFEMRATHDGRWAYVWNAWSNGTTNYRAENMQGLTWPAMTAAAATDPALAARVDFYLRRAPEELYDLGRDPYCLHNLAGKHTPPARAALRRQRDLTADWMTRTGDPLRDTYLTYQQMLDAA